MKKGQRYIITCGEYSDYGIRDSFMALRDFSFDLALAKWIEKNGDDGSFSYDDDKDEQAFLQSLRNDGLVVSEELNSVHLSNYSRAEVAPAQDSSDEPNSE